MEDHVAASRGRARPTCLHVAARRPCRHVPASAGTCLHAHACARSNACAFASAFEPTHAHAAAPPGAATTSQPERSGRPAGGREYVHAHATTVCLQAAGCMTRRR
eukprot:3892873-Pleurochrysis_carterae.AAC.1